MSTKPHHIGQQTRRKRTHTVVKRSNTRQGKWLKNVLVFACFLAAIGVFAFFAVVSASAQSTSSLSAAKQQLVQSQAQWHALVDQKKAPKVQVAPGSCPVDLHHAPVITTLTPEQVATMHNAYASFASVISAEQKPYFIFGENGKFVVQALPLDPCKVDPILQQQSKQTFRAPAASQGDLIILSVQGDLITYRASSGTTGVFNYVTGQFQPAS